LTAVPMDVMGRSGIDFTLMLLLRDRRGVAALLAMRRRG
jgi:hypothetical protein